MEHVAPILTERVEPMITTLFALQLSATIVLAGFAVAMGKMALVRRAIPFNL